MAKKKKVDLESTIVEHYMNAALEGELPDNVYKFCKQLGIQETEFYQHFGSLRSIDRRIWSKLFELSLDTVKGDESYEASSTQDKILMLYYTFFENCTMNRSYLLLSLDHHPGMREKLVLLGDMRTSFKIYTDELFAPNQSQDGRLKSELANLRQRGVGEGLWTQMLFLLDFWQKDDSAGFEKTDMAIEKSVRVAMQLLDTTPLESIVDLGKFLWKEKSAAK